MSRYRIVYQSSNIEAPEGPFDIGRSLDCNLVLDDPSVSRVHATIHKDGDILSLEDRGSRNGCAVNGEKVTGQVPLKDGDVITIGHQSIRIIAVRAERKVSAAAKNTMGIAACRHCGQWMSMEEAACPSCGKSRDTVHPGRPSDTRNISPPVRRDNTDQDTRIPTQHSGQMIAGLARKALGKNRTDEALKLTASLVEAALRRDRAEPVPEADLEDIVELLIEIGVATRSPERMSELFAFFATIGKLIPRKSVELLYNSIRKTGYRSCPEMHRYLTVLGELSRKFSPGEKFIHRRIEGLVGLCS